MKNLSISTIARTGVLIFALINQVLTILGYNPPPWSDEQAYEGFTLLLTTVAALWSWWKNNSFTAEAIEADKIMKELKAKKG